MELTAEQQLLQPDDPEKPYRRRKDEDKRAVHWGQRKLLLGEIQFLTRFWEPATDTSDNPVLVYAGAAPGTHIPILGSLFPNFTFHLYDPRPFRIKSTDRIKIYRRCFTDTTARYWSQQRQVGQEVYLVSDIRTGDYKTMSAIKNEGQIMDDMWKQARWYQTIQPSRAHFKFRLPYYEPNSPQPKNIQYLDGYLFKQVWAPQTSTETRLVPFQPTNGDQPMKIWSVPKYEAQMFHHNTTIREETTFLNPFTRDLNPVDQPELLNDFDSIGEVNILRDYLIKMAGLEMATQENIVNLSRLITDRLNDPSKQQLTIDWIRKNPRKH